MHEQYFDLAILEDDGRNVFDDIASKLEAASMSYSTGLTIEKKSQIENSISEIENVLIDIDEMKHEDFDYIKAETKKLLTVWYEVWSSNINNEAISIAFNDNIDKLKKVLFIILKEKPDKEKIAAMFSNFESSEQELKKIAKNNVTSLSSVVAAFLKDSFSTLNANFAASFLLGDISKFLTDKDLFDPTKGVKWVDEEVKYDQVWNLEIKVGGKTTDPDFLFFLWSLSEILNNIEDVKLEILNITKGSWIVRAKIWFKGIVGKEEVKTVIDKAINADGINVEKANVEVERLRLEKLKLESEKVKIEKESSNIPNNAEAKIKELNIKKLELEIQLLKASHLLKQLEGIEKYSQLLRAGIMRVDDLQIDINEILLLLKTGDNIQSRNSLNDIDNAGEQLP